MNSDQDPHEKAAADTIVLHALRIEDVDLEPTPDEVEFFLNYEPGVHLKEQTREEEETEGIEQAFAQYVAMNRKNAQNTYSDEMSAALEAKRRQLLEELEKTYGHVD